MTDNRDAIAEIDGCSSLFLIDLREGPRNSLYIRVTEGCSAGSPKSITIAGTDISDCTAVEITDKSRVFEIVWSSYVGYSVLNESYATPSGEEVGEGKRFRVYSTSRFIQFMSEATCARDDYPGPTRHYCVGCEDQILHVLSVGCPTVRRLSSSQPQQDGNLIQ